MIWHGEDPPSASPIFSRMSYAGFYINLDDSGDRRAEAEAEFARFGMSHRYRRFPAIRGNALGFPNPHLTESEIGCFTSHCLVLKENLAAAKHLHVVEDDVLFSRFTAESIRCVIETGIVDQFDILFTDTLVAPINGEYQYCKGLYDRSIDRDEAGAATAVRPQVIKFIAGTNSYIVNRNSVGKIVDILLRSLEAGATYPIDLMIRYLTDKRVLRVGALFPFVTSVRLAHTINPTIGGRRQHDLTAVAAWLGRQSFFVDCDIRALQAQAEQMLPIPVDDPRHNVLARVLAFTLTDKFQPH